MIEYEVIDNFLPKDEFIKLQSLILGNEFSWYYNDYIINDGREESNYQFTHLFYQDFKINSQHFEILNPLLFQMNVKALVRVKANLNPISHKLIEYDNHEDQKFKCKGAIYYINNNNGYTMFDNEKVESKENRIVFFDTDTKHFGTNSTNCKNRMVINFNYF